MPHRGGFIELIDKHLNVNLLLSGIEIGCWKGEFAHALLNKYGQLKLTSIDPFCYIDDIQFTTKDFNHRFRLLNLYSDEAARILQGQFDFVFIDGDHEYEQCRKDIINYSLLVRPGGLIAGHNYHKANDSAHPGVHQAVDEIFGDKVKLQSDFIWYIQKEEV